MNKLALCALLSAGVLSSVNGDDDIDRWLKENTIQIFDELGSLAACQEASEKVLEVIQKTKDTRKRGNLWRLGERLNSLCDFWEWFKEFDAANFQESDAERIFSEAASQSEDLEDGEKLMLLRDLKWGKGLKDETLRSKFAALEGKCKGFI